MSVSERIISILKNEKITFGVTVPCVLLDELINIMASDPEMTHVPVTREEEGMGICAGAHLAGKTPFVAMQNSGLGNSVNALCSLLQFYEMPLLMLISHRGTIGEKIAAQKPMGRAVPGILDVLGIEYRTLRGPDDVEEIRTLISRARETSSPVAALMPFSFWRGIP